VNRNFKLHSTRPYVTLSCFVVTPYTLGSTAQFTSVAFAFLPRGRQMPQLRSDATKHFLACIRAKAAAAGMLSLATVMVPSRLPPLPGLSGTS
jgi:hypothetical protein